MAIKKKRSRRSSGAVTVNFSGVESGGRRCPDGEYTAEIFEAELEESKAGNPMIVAKWKITEGKYKGVTIYDQISLVPQALWKMKTLLEVLEIDPQEEDTAVSDYVEEITDKPATIIVRNETFEGEDRPKVVGYGAGEEEESEEEEEEEPKVRNKGKAKAKAEEDDDDEEEDDEEDDAEDDEEDDEEEEKPAKKGAKKTTRVKEGSRVKFDDGEGHTIKGTVTSLDNGTATVEDKNGDEYEIDAEDVTLL